MKPKFKVGDKVMRNSNDTEALYEFEGTVGNIIEGDIVTISAVSISDSCYILYNIEGSYVKHPNWTNMEDNFDLARIDNWRERINNGNN